MSESTPLVSIVLPYYNADKTIQRAINSIVNQTYKNFELILVNNNSNDNSYEIAKMFSEIDSRVILVNEKKQGVVYAANFGNSIAKGQLIARMDADDVSYHNRIEKQVEHFRSNTALDVSATQVDYLSDLPSNTSFHHFVEWSNAICSPEQILKNRFVEFPLVNPSIMVRANVLQKVGSFEDGNFPEDYHWFLKAIEKKCIIEKIQIPLLQWHDTPERLTRTDTKYLSDAFFKLKTRFLALEIKKLSPSKGIWIWGAGKLGYQRSQWLLDHGISISGYIDIKNKRLEKYPCLHFSEVNISNHHLIISYISNRNRRDEVRDFLQSRNFIELKDYIIAG